MPMMAVNAMELHSYLVENTEITDNYTKRGTHDGCGECCSRFLPLTHAEAITMRTMARRVHVRPEQPGTIDMTCPFLSESKRCSIYQYRPSICRAYNCAEHKKLGGLGIAHGLLDIGQHYELRDVRELVG